MTNKKYTNTCNDCIHYDICYKIEHFGRDLETNIPCKEFIGVNDRVEVVRCKDCKNYEIGKDYEPYCNHINGLDEVKDNDYCSYGERRD